MITARIGQFPHTFSVTYSKYKILGILLIGMWVIAACAPSPPPVSSTPSDGESEYRIITLLPKDGIPSIDDPQFLTAAEADLEYDDEELVIGVEFDDEARAYSIDLLSSREIVNDEIKGRPIAVTW